MRVNCCFSPGGSLKNKIRSWKSPGKVQEFHHPKGVGTLFQSALRSVSVVSIGVSFGLCFVICGFRRGIWICLLFGSASALVSHGWCLCFTILLSVSSFLCVCGFRSVFSSAMCGWVVVFGLGWLVWHHCGWVRIVAVPAFIAKVAVGSISSHFTIHALLFPEFVSSVVSCLFNCVPNVLFCELAISWCSGYCDFCFLSSVLDDDGCVVFGLYSAFLSSLSNHSSCVLALDWHCCCFVLFPLSCLVVVGWWLSFLWCLRCLVGGVSGSFWAFCFPVPWQLQSSATITRFLGSKKSIAL